MSPLFLLVPVAVGIAAVLQGGLNRQISSSWGLAGAALLNCLVVTTCALLCFVAVRAFPQYFPEIFRWKPAERPSWWYLVPGTLGFFLVIGVPFAIQRIGALRVFLIVFVSQTAAALVWDLVVEKIPLGAGRIVGTLLALAGTILVSLQR